MTRRADLPPFDFTDDDRQELQCILLEFEGALGSDKAKIRAAELVLLRKFWQYAKQFPYHFPPRLQAAVQALRRQSYLELAAANERAEIEG